MVSKAREDLPEPLTPVTTVRASWGISTVMFLRLWTRAPRTRRTSCCWRVGAMVSFVAKGSSVSRLFACCVNLKVYDSLDGGANWRYIATEERTNAALSKMSFPAQPAARGYSRLVSVRAL